MDKDMKYWCIIVFPSLGGFLLLSVGILFDNEFLGVIGFVNVLFSFLLAHIILGIHITKKVLNEGEQHG